MKTIIENIKTSAIIPYERNARKNDAAVKEVIKSIERTGYRTPIIIDENFVILAGHTRHKAITKMGWKEIPFVVQYSDLTESQKQEYRIRDNKTGEIAEWDFEILEADFSSDELIDFGFDIKDLTQPEVEEDEAPPVPEIARTFKGDIYTLGQHRVMCGDSTMIDDVEKLMDGNKADMVFTDPPYLGEMGRGGFSRDISLQKSKDKKIDAIRSIYNFDPTETFPIIETIKKDICNVFMFCNKNLVPKYLNYAIETGRLFDILTWHKTSYIPANNNTYYPDTEYLIKIKDKGACFKTGLGNLVNYGKYWILNQKEKLGHPTVKPQKIIKDCLLICSEEKNLICDIFLGSGSTLIACEQTNRICYGMELDEKYCDVIVQRWVNFTGGKVILNGQEIEWEKTDGK
jgi:site-specific DNA-methyltransferase (adenine-specific)